MAIAPKGKFKDFKHLFKEKKTTTQNKTTLHIPNKTKWNMFFQVIKKLIGLRISFRKQSKKAT